MNNETISTPETATIVDVLTASAVESYDIDTWCVKEARKASRYSSANSPHHTLRETTTMKNPTEFGLQAAKALEVVTRYNDARSNAKTINELYDLLDELIADTEEEIVTAADRYLLDELLADASPEEQAAFGYEPTHTTEETTVKTYPTQTPAHILIARYLGRGAGYVYARRAQIIDAVLEAAAITALLLFITVAAIAWGVNWVAENIHKVPAIATEVAEIVNETVETVTEVAKTTAAKVEKVFYSTAFYILIGVGLTVAAGFVAVEVAKSLGRKVNWLFDTYIAGV